MRNNKGEMTRFGIGPRLASLSITYCLGAFILTRYWAPLFNLGGIPDKMRLGMGVTIIAVGIPFFIIAVISMSRAYNAGRLATKGIFGCCRNPVYAAWIVFIVPGLALLVNSLLVLTAPIVMYILFRILIEKEERFLEGKFGDQYRVYRENIPELLPIGWIVKRKI